MDLSKLKKWILLIAIFICIITIILIMVILNKGNNEPNSIFRQDTKKEHIDTIQYLEFNEIPSTYISDVQMCNIYLLDYKNNALYHTQEAYNSLNEEYREKRFGNFNTYEKYVQEHIDDILQIKLDKYQIIKYDNYIQYICIDQFGNYYIFNETAIMRYTVLLDTYTIDLPQYIEAYNKSNNTQKVAMCINRFINAIKDKNYIYAYSLLSSGFKQNYFSTQEQFESYIKQNITKIEQVMFNTVKTEGNLYMYTVTLSPQITKTFIVNLKQGTDFELSFNV